jgi:LysR family transcriptional activator of nhaA
VKLDGVTKAAQYLNTSQSSLSTQMKQFEEYIGRKVFVRDGRKLHLTSEGQTVYSYCKASFELFEEMGAFLENKNLSGRKKLRIGVSDEVERPFISSVISRLIKRDIKNNSTVSLRSESHKEIAEAFLTRDVDLVITSDPIYSSGIKYMANVFLPVGIVFNSRVFGDFDDTDTIKKIVESAKIGLALPGPTLKLRKEIDNYLSKNKILRDICFESNVVSTIVRAVLDGLAFSILPLPYVQNEIDKERLTTIPLKNGTWKHQLFIYSYSGKVLDDICMELSTHTSVEIKKVSVV